MEKNKQSKTYIYTHIYCGTPANREKYNARDKRENQQIYKINKYIYVYMGKTRQPRKNNDNREQQLIYIYNIWENKTTEKNI